MKRTAPIHALLTACALILCAPSASEAAAPPAPAAPAPEYQARHVCAAPAPGYASCMALELPGARIGLAQAGPRYAAGQQPEPVFPAELRSAYHLPITPVKDFGAQTIALVDAYNDLEAEADLKVYDNAPSIKLSECNRANGCFRKVNQNGASAAEAGASGNPFPRDAKELQERKATCTSGKEKQAQEAACAEVEEAEGWTVEISTDVDVAHAVCQSCHILLVEADSSSYEDLETAEETAVRLGATEVSNSWGGPEPALDSPAFDHPGTVITAAAGDDGYLNWTEAEEAAARKEGYYSGADYPASSPHVVAVGGTELALTAAGTRQSETVWNEDPDPEGKNEGAGGGGCSVQFAAPEWQLEVPDWTQVGCGTGAEPKRAVADVAADADPYSGVVVYDSEESKENMIVIGGTSVASPIVASVFALAGGARGVKYPAQTLYSHLGRPSLYDVTEGGNGECDDLYTGGCSGSLAAPLDCGAGALICNAATGYDGPTGVGTPNGILAFEPGGEAANVQRAEAELKAEEAQIAEEHKAAEERKAAEEARAEEELKDLEAEAAKAAAEKKAEEARNAAKKLEEEERTGGGLGGGKGEGHGDTANSASTGANQPAAGTGTSSQSSAGGSSPSRAQSGASGSGHGAVRLSHLALTARAGAAIARGVPTLSQVAFAFTLSARARVHATLARQVREHGRLRWAAVPSARTLTAARGRDRAYLRGHGTLARGRYRLTLTPAHGAARSLVFVVG
jgi:hypothetical protein